MPTGLHPGINHPGSGSKVSKTIAVGYVYLELPNIAYDNASVVYQQLVEQLERAVLSHTEKGGGKPDGPAQQARQAVIFRDQIRLATFDRMVEDGCLGLRGTICVLVEMPMATSIRQRKSSFFLGWALPAGCTVYYGQTPPLLSERSLALALLRGPQCSMSDFMAYSTLAPGYGLAPAEVFLPLQLVDHIRWAHPYRFDNRGLADLTPLPYRHCALAMLIAWQKQAKVLLAMPLCAPASSSTDPENLRELSPQGTRLFAQYLLAAAQQIPHLRAVAEVLSVPAGMLPDAAEISQLADRCRSAAAALRLQSPAVELVPQQLTSLGQLDAQAARLIMQEEAALTVFLTHAKSSCSSIGKLLFEKTKRWLEYDAEEMSKPRFATFLQTAHGMSPAKGYYQILRSPAWATYCSFGIDQAQLLACFILLNGMCPIDGKPMTLVPNSPQAHLTRAISADRINGNFGLHSMTSCIFIAGEHNLARKDLFRE